MGTGSNGSPFLDVARMHMSTVYLLALLDLGILCQQDAFFRPLI